jgi:hypothetical protein
MRHTPSSWGLLTQDPASAGAAPTLARDPLIGARLSRVLQGFSHNGARPGPRLQAGHRLGQSNVGL